MTLVTPIAKERYERREEQTFRDWARRNVEQAQRTAGNAQTAADGAQAAADGAQATADSIASVWAFGNLPEYVDDTDAGVGGLVQGDFYRTATGQLMVKL